MDAMEMLKAAVRGAALAAFAGCATVYRVSETPVAAEKPAAPVMRKPVAAVSAAATDAAAQPLAARLKGAVENSLAARGFVTGGEVEKPDSRVELAVARRETARLDEWRTLEGRAEVRITDAKSGKLAAGKTFVAAGERALDDERAQAGVETKLATQVCDWLRESLPAREVPVPPPPQPTFAAAIVTITPADPSTSYMKALVVQRSFMQTVASHPGVKSCTLERSAAHRPTYAFKVVYDAAAFPAGLLETIVLDSLPPEGVDRIEIDN